MSACYWDDAYLSFAMVLTTVGAAEFLYVDYALECKYGDGQPCDGPVIFCWTLKDSNGLVQTSYPYGSDPVNPGLVGCGGCFPSDYFTNGTKYRAYGPLVGTPSSGAGNYTMYLTIYNGTTCGSGTPCTSTSSQPLKWDATNNWQYQ